MSKSQNNKGPAKDSYSGTSDKGEEEEGVYNVGILEQDLMDEYRTPGRTFCKPLNYDDKTMIVMYRMNCKKNNSEGTYEGRVDFRVGVGGRHVLCRNPIHEPPPLGFNLAGSGYIVRSKALNLCDNELVSTPHCRIQGPGYPDDFIWIEDLKSEHGTFVNGKRIRSDERYRVFCGDIIGLGAPYGTQDQWGDPHDDKRGFVFTLKNFGICESNSEELSPEAGPTFLALNNTVILDAIVKYLKMKDLKAARLVNRWWKNRVDPRLVGSSFMSFCHGREEEDWDAAFQGKVSMIREYGLGNWKLKIFDSRISKRQNKDRRVHTDVQWLVEQMGHHARTLELMSNCWPHPWGSTIPNVLSHFRNLEKLKIFFVLPLPLLDAYFISPTTFPSVTELNLSMSCIWDGGVPGTGLLGLSHFTPFTQLLPNIRKFQASGEQFFLMINYINENPQVWPNLKELKGTGGSDEYENQTTVRIIGTLPHKLTKIEYSVIRFSKDVGCNLELMMNNHSKTLEHLYISFEVTTEQDWNVLRFPSFPRLKVLIFGANLKYKVPTSLGTAIMFPSGGGSVCYEKDLPQIQKLSVNFYRYEKDPPRLCVGIDPIMKETMDVFVPKDRETVSRTMRWISLGIRQRDYVKDSDLPLDNPSWYEEFLKRFVKVFPYVHDPYVIRDLKLFNIQESKG